jgi:hypothetical protein
VAEEVPVVLLLHANLALVCVFISAFGTIDEFD